MSHDSGFRRGGLDFTHKQSGRSQAPKNRTRRSERNAEKRFHQHERDRETGVDEGKNES